VEQQQKPSLFRAHVYIYVKGHPLFADELKLVEEEMLHINEAIDRTECHGNKRLLRRKDHLEVERQRHIQQKTSWQRRVDARRRNSNLIVLPKQREPVHGNSKMKPDEQDVSSRPCNRNNHLMTPANKRQISNTAKAA
jgi:hypothetical protein